MRAIWEHFLVDDSAVAELCKFWKLTHCIESFYGTGKHPGMVPLTGPGQQGYKLVSGVPTTLRVSTKPWIIVCEIITWNVFV